MGSRPKIKVNAAMETSAMTLLPHNSILAFSENKQQCLNLSIQNAINTCEITRYVSRTEKKIWSLKTVQLKTIIFDGWVMAENLARLPPLWVTKTCLWDLDVLHLIKRFAHNWHLPRHSAAASTPKLNLMPPPYNKVSVTLEY